MTLAQYITAHLNTAFKWGEHDCVLFVAGWVRAATGLDPLAGLPRWRTARDAYRVIQAVGGLEAALDARFLRTEPALAFDGALAIRRGGLCIFTGAHIVGAGAAGLTFIDRMEAEIAWSITN